MSNIIFLTHGVSLCQDLGDFPVGKLDNMLEYTTRYELRGEQLFLIGEEVELVLKPDLANYFRGDRVEFIRHNWQLSKVHYYAIDQSFNALEPIIIRFQHNFLIVEAPNCINFSYMIASRMAHSYHLVNRDVHPPYPDNEFPDCGEPANQQITPLGEALEATTRYKFEGDQLYLLGDDVEVILAPEPISDYSPSSTSPLATPTP